MAEYDIKFYRVNEPYGCFSNFAKFPIEIEGKIWPTTEHYFQAQKFIDMDYVETIRLAKTPMIAAKMGRDRSKSIRKDWEKCKDEVMRKAVKVKVEQHKVVRDILISTGNCNLIEHTVNDSYWADNGDGTGLNILGKILMEVRNSLEDYTDEFYLPQWLTYPDIHPSDMFWRMGAGEGYVMAFAKWYYSLSKEAQKEYDSYFIPPEEWKENM